MFAIPSFNQVLKEKTFEPHKGFFNFYYEENQDKSYLEVDKIDYGLVRNYALKNEDQLIAEDFDIEN